MAGVGGRWLRRGGFCRPVAGSEILPDKKAVKIYDKLLEKYAACESDALDVFI